MKLINFVVFLIMKNENEIFSFFSRQLNAKIQELMVYKSLTIISFL